MAKPHPVEAYDAQLMANAVSFTAFQFRGRGDRRKEDNLPNIEAARAAARAILAEGQHGRPVSIYAIDAAGNQAHIENVPAA